MKRRFVRPFALVAAMFLVPACGSSGDSSGPILLSLSRLKFTGPVAGPDPASKQVRLRNHAGAASPLSWTADADQPWLSFTPKSGTTGAETEFFTIAVTAQRAEAWTADTTTTGAPAGREDFSMVWTGSEVLIWGGLVAKPTTMTNGGARYDPATDSWTGTLSTTGAPVARWGHTAVWTGTEMIVWGGSDEAGIRMNDGYRYDPGTDTWSSPISTVSAPAPRRAHTAVWTGSEMIIWGGEVGGVPVNTGARYDPQTDTWTPVTMTGAPSIRWHHAAVWTGDEMIVWGGFDLVDGVDTGKRYSPATDTWGAATSTTGVPPGKMTASAVWTGQEMIIFGGQTTEGTAGTNTGGRYDPVLDSWQPTTTTNAPDVRFGHEGVWAGGEMIIWGGDSPLLNTGKRYVPPIALPPGTHTGLFTVRDPHATNSPRHVTVTFRVDP